jgi:Zn-dependent peptidase ImmA (M78 family)
LAANHFSGEQPHEHGARRALELRIELGLSDEPIPDLWALVRERGVHLAFRAFGEDAGDGLYVWNGDSALIVANSSTRSRLRQRFTVAHELGHHEIHRPAEGTYLHTDKNIHGSKDPIEQEANAFAGHLLAPDPALRRIFAEWQVVNVDPIVIARLMQR